MIGSGGRHAADLDDDDDDDDDDDEDLENNTELLVRFLQNVISAGWPWMVFNFLICVLLRVLYYMFCSISVNC